MAEFKKKLNFADAELKKFKKIYSSIFLSKFTILCKIKSKIFAKFCRNFAVIFFRLKIFLMNDFWVTSLMLIPTLRHKKLQPQTIFSTLSLIIIIDWWIANLIVQRFFIILLKEFSLLLNRKNDILTNDLAREERAACWSNET